MRLWLLILPSTFLGGEAYEVSGHIRHLIYDGNGLVMVDRQNGSNDQKRRVS